MTAQSLTHAPNGKRAPVSMITEDWWSVDGATGYISPKLLAPDPDQPRKWLDPIAKAELAESIAEVGVREVITVTPRSAVPWARIALEHDDLPFVIVSGHSRTAAAIEADAPKVMIRIVMYVDELAHRTDASVLNKHRNDLAPLDEGYELLRLEDLGATQKALSKKFGKSVMYLTGRKNLTRLHPALQRLLDPALPQRQQANITVMSEIGGVESPTVDELSELHVSFKDDIDKAKGELRPTVKFYDLDDDERRFEFQKILHAVISSQKLKALRAIDFVREQNLQLEASEKRSNMRDARRFDPNARKKILRALTSGATGSTVMGWLPGEFERIFHEAPIPEVEKYRNDYRQTASMFEDIAKIFDRIIKDKRKEFRQ